MGLWSDSLSLIFGATVATVCLCVCVVCVPAATAQRFAMQRKLTGF